jgi:hypothetical protein
MVRRAKIARGDDFGILKEAEVYDLDLDFSLVENRYCQRFL